MHGNLISAIAYCFDYIASSKMKCLKCLKMQFSSISSLHLQQIFIQADRLGDIIIHWTASSIYFNMMVCHFAYQMKSLSLLQTHEGSLGINVLWCHMLVHQYLHLNGNIAADTGFFKGTLRCQTPHQLLDF